MVKHDRNAYKVFCIGDKGSVALSRSMTDIFESSITNVTTPLNFPTAASIAHQVFVNSKDCDRVLLIYNEFKNVISQIQRKREVMTRN